MGTPPFIERELNSKKCFDYFNTTFYSLGTVTRIVVPLPGADSIFIFPPIASALSAAPTNPRCPLRAISIQRPGTTNPAPSS
jgi:hypothetical protein